MVEKIIKITPWEMLWENQPAVRVLRKCILTGEKICGRDRGVGADSEPFSLHYQLSKT
jgi:hypothetical protein